MEQKEKTYSSKIQSHSLTKVEKGGKRNFKYEKRILNKLHWTTQDIDIRNGVKGYTTSRPQANFFQIAFNKASSPVSQFHGGDDGL